MLYVIPMIIIKIYILIDFSIDVISIYRIYTKGNENGIKTCHYKNWLNTKEGNTRGNEGQK